MGITDVMWPYMGYGSCGGCELIRRTNIILWHKTLGILMRKYKYHEYHCIRHVEYRFVL